MSSLHQARPLVFFPIVLNTSLVEENSGSKDTGAARDDDEDEKEEGSNRLPLTSVKAVLPLR